MNIASQNNKKEERNSKESIKNNIQRVFVQFVMGTLIFRHFQISQIIDFKKTGAIIDP